MTISMCRLTIFLCIALFLVGCDKTSDEEKIAHQISGIQEAVELKDFSDVEKYLHNDFLANERLSTKESGQLLKLYSMRHRNIGVTIVASNTTMDSTFTDRAKTTMSVVVTGAAARLPSDGSIRTVQLEWVKQSGDWLVRRAKWEHY